ncbi:MAG: pathogenicity locus [Elusimicrobia bacterium]|nr:pathogenicity locus [Elusimicrobiota bacterium]
MTQKSEVLRELRKIPGVGASIALDLYAIGIRSIADLKDKSPEKLYDQSNKLVGQVQDRCLLYVFRTAVYYAREKRPDPWLLKWWNWKDRRVAK